MVRRIGLETLWSRRPRPEPNAELRAAPPAAEAPALRRSPAERGLGARGQAILERLFGGAPAAAPRATAERSEAPVLAIGSGKGGTGKSFVSTSLAIELHRMGHRVALVDCDFGLACLHLLLGVQPKRHVRHLVTGESTLDDVLLETPLGPTLLPGVTGVRQMTELTAAQIDLLGRAIGELAATHDVVLLDSGAGLTMQTCALLAAADHVILVAQPEIAALTDAYAVVKTLTQLRAEPRVGVIVNRVHDEEHGPATHAKLDEVSVRHTGVALDWLGSLADDPEVTQRRLDQAPLVVTDPDRPVCRQVYAVARAVASCCAPLAPRPRAAHTAFADRLRLA